MAALNLKAPAGHRTVIYDPLRDAPSRIEPPLKPLPRQLRKVLAPSRQRLAMFLTAMLGAAQAQSPFQRSSEKDLTDRLQKFRGLNGNLQIDKLSPEDLIQLQTRIKSTADEVANLATNAIEDQSQDMMTAIADTGCCTTLLASRP